MSTLDQRFMMLSGLCLAAGVLLVLFPKTVAQLNTAMDRTVRSVDGFVMRYRHLIGTLLLVAGYLFFRMAFTLPEIVR